MARGGSFGGSLPGLRPFGGLGSGFAQYNVGKTAAQLAASKRYAVEVAWSNGQATDGDYLDALRAEIAATDPDTDERLSAQNRYDDAVFSIGRAQAQKSGDPEALIAFDQAALAKMQPGNKRYNDLAFTLAAELADRRSRQYSKLVDEYQAGNATTETLLAWVQSTISTLPAGAPDADAWRHTVVDLQDRIQNEKDAKVFQDYQHERISGEAFIAYLTKRRDSYLPGSPLYQEWGRKLDDAQEQVKSAALVKQDNEFFARYNRGNKALGDPGDAEYLQYIRDRLAGMKPNDPNRLEWQHRLETATYSLAEDKLRLDVAENKRPASDLVAFYEHYIATLRPDSPEWRTVRGRLDEAKRTDFGQSEDEVTFRVQNRLLPVSALVDFYTKHLGTLEKDTPDWRDTYNKLQSAKRAVAGDAEALAEFQIQFPNAPTGSGLVTRLPDGNIGLPHGGTGAPVGGRGTTVPAGATFAKPASGKFMYAGHPEEFKGGAYTSDQLDYVANRIAAGTGLDPAVVRVWVRKEQGHANNPLGTSTGGDAGYTGNVGILATYDTLDHGIDAAINWINTHGNMRGIKESAGKSQAEQLRAIDASPWGPGGYGPNGGYPAGGVQALAARVGLKTPGPTGTSAPATATGGTVAVTAPGTDATPARTSRDDLVKLRDLYQRQVDSNPVGSPAWQTAYRKLQGVIDELAKPDPQAIGPDVPGKAISPRATTETLVAQVRLTPSSSEYAVANYETNRQSLRTAWQRGDRVWLFFDPANPNATTWAKNPDGSYIYDENGKHRVIPGSGYYQVTTEAVARFEEVRVGYYSQLRDAARANGQNTDAQKYQGNVNDSLDEIRTINKKQYQAVLRTALEGDGSHQGILGSIDHAWTVGDLRSVLNYGTDALNIIGQISDDPQTDEALRTSLGNKADAITAHPLWPDPATGRAGAIDFANSPHHVDPNTGATVYDDVVLNPGYHLVFDMADGKRTFDVKEETTPPDVWAQTHVTVHTKFGDRVVTAEAPIESNAPIDPLISATINGKSVLFKMNGVASSASFFDGSGVRQTMYSIDGQTWIRPNAGQPPMLQLKPDITDGRFDADAGLFVYSTGNFREAVDPWEAGAPRIVFYADGAGNIATQGNSSRPAIDTSALQWYGQDKAQASVASNPFNDARIQQLVARGASASDIRKAILEGATPGYTPSAISGTEVGGPGQHMTLAFTSADGAVNMLPPNMAKFGPDWLPTTGANPVNDLLGKTRDEIAAMPQDRYLLPAETPKPGGAFKPQVVPGKPFVTPPTTDYRPPTSLAAAGSVDAYIAITGQLPTNTPPRLDGLGIGSQTASAPVRPLPPPGPTFVTPPTTNYVAPAAPRVTPLPAPAPKPAPAVPAAKPAPSVGGGAGTSGRSSAPLPSSSKPNVQAAASLPKPKPAPKPTPAPTPVKSGPNRAV